MNHIYFMIAFISSNITFKRCLIFLFYFSGFMSYYPEFLGPIPHLSHFVVPFVIFVPFFLYLIFIRGGKPILNRYFGVLILYYTWIALSFFIHPGSYSDTKIWFIRASCYIFMAIVSVHVFDKKDLQTIGWVIVFIAVTNAVYSYFQLGLGEEGRSSHFHDRNLFSRFQVIAYSFLLIDWLIKSKKIYDFRILFMIIILGSMVHQQSRSGLLMFIISTGFILIHTKNKRIIVSGIVVGAFVVSVIAAPVIYRLKYTDEAVANYSDFGRISTMVAGVNMIKDKPIIGIGYFNSLYEFKHYQQKSLIGFKGMSTIHNVYVSIWAELGIVGLLLFLYLNIGLFIKIYKKIWHKGVTFKEVRNEVFYSLILLIYLFHGLVYHSFDYEAFYWYYIVFAIIVLMNPSSKTIKQQE